MKKTIFATTLPLFFAWSSICISETCFTVEGKVNTVNVSETTQIGSIDLLILDEWDNEAFRQTGNLTGNITGGDFTATYLSHTAIFSDGSTFVTSGDEAVVTAPFVRKYAESGAPCSFFINEKITNIVEGSGFFADINSVQIHADGYISACMADGENENEFELTGQICIN